MKYFETVKNSSYTDAPDLKNSLHNFNSIAYVHREYWKIPSRTAIAIHEKDRVFFSGLLPKPFPLLSREAWEVVRMFHSDLAYKEMFLTSRESGTYLYFLPLLRHVPVGIHQQKMAPHISQYVVNESQARHNALFLAAGLDTSVLIMRLDIVEAMLRRGITGYSLLPVEGGNVVV